MIFSKKNFNQKIFRGLISGILSEGLLDTIYRDVDLIYNKFFKKDVYRINNNIHTTYYDINHSELDTSIFKSSLLRKCHSLNPCKIFINYKNKSNMFIPTTNEIYFGINNLALSHFFDHKTLKIAIDSLPINQRNGFEKEFSEYKIKGSIHHEIAHWVDETLNKKHITKSLKKHNAQNINTSDIEIQGIIHNVYQFKKIYNGNWDLLTFDDLYKHIPSFNGAIRTFKGDETLISLWKKKIKGRMAREGLLGRNMR